MLFTLNGPIDLRMGRALAKPVASNTENRQLEVTGLSILIQNLPENQFHEKVVRERPME
jgi:hypothetical protein